MSEDTFANCFSCGQCVYIDGFGDDVIPTGYITDEGEVYCEGCYSGEDEDD